MALAVIKRATSVAGGATNENLIAGSSYEYANGPSVASIALVTTAAGCFATITAGGRTVAEEFPVSVKATDPVIPDDFYFTAAMVQGERLVIRVRNTTGGALTLTNIVQLADG